jgi:hypothetical protein
LNCSIARLPFIDTFHLILQTFMVEGSPDMSCQYYPPADLDELEEVATEATVGQQIEALQIIAAIFSRHQLPYGVMGGMNFYFRGSGRTTDDVDLAVTGSQSLQTTLDLLNHDER